MKKIARYTYDVTTNTLTMSPAFEKKARTYGTAEYHILMELRRDHAELKIEVETPKKTPRGGLAFEQMEIYIKYHRDAENRLSIFERVKALSKSQANPYSKQHLATSNMKDGQEARELFIIRAVPTVFKSIQKTSKLLPAGFYTPLYPFLVKAKGYKRFFLANLCLPFQALRLLVLLVIDIQSC